MNPNPNNIPVTDQNEAAYGWLEERGSLIESLAPAADGKAYRLALEGLIREGKAKLDEVDGQDPALVCGLKLLAAEAQIDLALVEGDPERRRGYIDEGCEICVDLTGYLKNQRIGGLAGSVLPRVITLLSGACLSTASNQRQLLEEAVKNAADLLDESRIWQAYERGKAVQKIVGGKVFALSASVITDQSDRRIVLEKAAASLHEAEAYGAFAFDDALAANAVLCLEAVESALRSPDLPVPVFPISGEPEDASFSSPVCVGCGARLKPTSRFCPQCGRPAPQAALAPAPVRSAPAPSPSPVCPRCGEKARPGAQFCRSCGNQLT